MSSITHNSVETEATITALKAEIERLERVSELKSDRIEELERELFGEDMSAVTMVDLLQEQLAAMTKERDELKLQVSLYQASDEMLNECCDDLAAAQAREAKLRDIIFVKLEEK